jgi:hypothetical protein
MNDVATLPYSCSLLSITTWLLSPLVVAFGFWTCFGACVDAPIGPEPPQARVVAAWDALACGDPHRVVIELADDTGDMRSVSTPCALGGLTIDIAHFGMYRGRIYAWSLGAPIRSIVSVELPIEAPLVRLHVDTPR